MVITLKPVRVGVTWPWDFWLRVGECKSLTSCCIYLWLKQARTRSFSVGRQMRSARTRFLSTRVHFISPSVLRRGVVLSNNTLNLKVEKLWKKSSCISSTASMFSGGAPGLHLGCRDHLWMMPASFRDTFSGKVQLQCLHSSTDYGVIFNI